MSSHIEWCRFAGVRAMPVCHHIFLYSHQRTEEFAWQIAGVPFVVSGHSISVDWCGTNTRSRTTVGRLCDTVFYVGLLLLGGRHVCRHLHSCLVSLET